MMQHTRRCLVACLALALPLFSAGVVIKASSSLSFDAEAASARPVTKVISLLKNMLKELGKEAKEDEEVYDKLACWCQDNEREKTEAINDAEVKIEKLTGEIKEGTAKSASLDTTVKNRESEVAKNQLSLDKATAIRQKEMAAFKEEEKDLVESVRALKAAIGVLSKHHSPGAALLQMPRGDAVRVQAALQATMTAGALTRSQKQAAAAFLQEPGFNYKPSFEKTSYAPQSGEIFGILNSMLETFEASLSTAQKEELASQKAFDELKGAKEGEIQAGQDNIGVESQELADTDQALALDKEDKTDTTEALQADETFLSDLRSKCELSDKEWEDRKKTRAEEMKAISEALAIISGDDAHDTFTRTFTPALVQRSSTVQLGGRGSRALALLAGAAKRLQSPQLSVLAVGAKLDDFTRVKKAIDDMVETLLKEKADEIKHRDFCIEEFNGNERQTDKKKKDHADLVVDIQTLEAEIKKLEDEISALNAEIAEHKLQIKHAGEDREKQNMAFHMTIADQRETQKLVKAAMSVLQEYYSKKAPTLDLLQKREQRGQQERKQGQEPPAGFKPYEDNKASQGVMKMMQQVVDDAKSLEQQTTRDEEDAQKSYEDFVKDSNAAIEAKTSSVVDKTDTKAHKSGVLHEEKHPAKKAVELDLEQLGNYKGQLHESCDFVLDNFDARQHHRDEEVEALKNAKAILSGSDLAAP